MTDREYLLKLFKQVDAKITCKNKYLIEIEISNHSYVDFEFNHSTGKLIRIYD